MTDFESTDGNAIAMLDNLELVEFEKYCIQEIDTNEEAISILCRDCESFKKQVKMLIGYTDEMRERLWKCRGIMKLRTNQKMQEISDLLAKYEKEHPNT